MERAYLAYAIILRLYVELFYVDAIEYSHRIAFNYFSKEVLLKQSYDGEENKIAMD